MAEDSKAHDPVEMVAIRRQEGGTLVESRAPDEEVHRGERRALPQETRVDARVGIGQPSVRRHDR